MWSDSTIALHWIKSEPHNLKTFVANRVQHIQEYTSNCKWNYIPTTENPADFISRGVLPHQIKNNKLWWYGPQFLQTENDNWPAFPTQKLDISINQEYKQTFNTIIQHGNQDNLTFIQNISSYNKLIRVTAYCLRFGFNCKNKIHKIGALTTDELSQSLKSIVKMVQSTEFENEFKCLTKEKQINSDSKIIKLVPFLDTNGLIRVGGRLQHSELDYNQKHPVLLPARHHFTTLLLQNEHLKHLHAGPQLLLSVVRQHFWPINGLQEAKKVVNKCVICFKNQPRKIQQIMGALPRDRIQPGRPFNVTGIDYAGPFLVRQKNQRGGINVKAYIAIFICFSTKAVHFEVISDLSTSGFLAALKRFVARRGRCAKIMSDNGTNFVGANNELKKIQQFLQSNSTIISSWCANETIAWEFIPPRSPHMGGLWEAGVKGFKKHFYRVVGQTTLTFEELNTLSIQIESCLNSRPISPLSSDPNELEALTPSHFLTGTAENNIFELDIQDLNINRLAKWQKITQMYQHIWSRWTNEYLHTLQQRKKWHKKIMNIELNQLVLIIDENQPPNKWAIGRVLATHPGKDGFVRVVDLKTKNGATSRAISRICPFPDTD